MSLNVVAETSHALPLVGLTVALRAGAVHDPPGRGGLARLVARMLRRGCQGLGTDQVEERFDALGAELSTAVGLTVASVHVEFLSRSAAAVAELLAQVLSKPTFDGAELGRLQRQTEAEIIESRDSDAFLAGRALRSHLFRGHRHAARPAGSISTVRAIDRDAVVEFHRQHYTRQNAVIAVSGDLSESQVEELVATVMSGLPEGAVLPYPAAEPQAPKDRRLVLVDKPERTQAQMAIGTLGTHPQDDDHTALLVANTAFGGTFTSRLVQEVRTKRGWSYGAASVLNTGRVREGFTMWTAPAAEDAAPCLALQLRLLSQWRQDGISADELAFCKSYLRRSYAFEVDTARKRVGQRLERQLLDLPEDYHDGFVARVEATSLDQANEAVRRRISEQALWVAVVCTHDEIGAKVRDAVPNLAGVDVIPHDTE